MVSEHRPKCAFNSSEIPMVRTYIFSCAAAVVEIEIVIIESHQFVCAFCSYHSTVRFALQYNIRSNYSHIFPIYFYWMFVAKVSTSYVLHANRQFTLNRYVLVDTSTHNCLGKIRYIFMRFHSMLVFILCQRSI